MRYRFTNPFNPGRALHSHRMLQLLEIRKLPVAGMPARMLPGIASDGKPVEIRVWVAPFVPKFRKRMDGTPVRVKSSTHRVRCACPGCGAELSAGRLFQHVCSDCKCERPPPADGSRIDRPVCLHRDCPQHGSKALPDVWRGLPTLEHVITSAAWNGLR